MLGATVTSGGSRCRHDSDVGRRAGGAQAGIGLGRKTPPPLAGGGWGEGAGIGPRPLPPTPPARGGGVYVGLDQARGEEAVHAAVLGPHAGQCPQIALLGQRLRQGRKFRRRERIKPQTAANHGSLDTRGALLGLQRAYRVDQPATLAEHAGRSPQQPVLRLHQRTHVAWPLDARHIGVPADRSGGAARCVQQHGVEWLGRRPVGGVGLHEFGLQMPMPQVVLQSRQTGWITLDCDHGCAGRGKLCRLPAGRRAEIRNAFPGTCGKQPGRQGGSGVLHPELAAIEAGYIGEVGSHRKAHRPSGQSNPPGRQRRGVRGHVEWRLALMGNGDLARLVPPRRPEPGWRVQPRSVQIRQRRRAGLGHTTENGIDHPREWHQPAGARQRDRGGNRGMAWCVQQQQTGGTQSQHMACRLGRRLAKERLQHRVQCSHPPQHRGGQPMRRRSIPWRNGGKRVQRLLERPATVQDRGQQIEGSLTRRVGHQRAVARQATSRPCSRQRAST